MLFEDDDKIRCHPVPNDRKEILEYVNEALAARNRNDGIDDCRDDGEDEAWDLVKAKPKNLECL
jgi:hypothetical protein